VKLYCCAKPGTQKPGMQHRLDDTKNNTKMGKSIQRTWSKRHWLPKKSEATRVTTQFYWYKDNQARPYSQRKFQEYDIFQVFQIAMRFPIATN
jgi:hypothetical protein